MNITRRHFGALLVGAAALPFVPDIVSRRLRSWANFPVMEFDFVNRRFVIDGREYPLEDTPLTLFNTQTGMRRGLSAPDLSSEGLWIGPNDVVTVGTPT